jgi:hypothetical protein
MIKMIGTCPEFVRDIIQFNEIELDHPQNLLIEYQEAWLDWLTKEESDSIKGLGPHFYQTNGVHGALIHLVNEFSDELFQTFTRDYAFYDYLLKNKRQTKISQKEEIKNGAIILMSYPGITRHQLDDVMMECGKKNAKIILDCAYFGTTRDCSIMLHDCVEAAAFSLSKAFNLGGLRIGGLFTKNPISTLDICQNSKNYYFNSFAAKLGRDILTVTSPEVLPRLFKPYQTMVCDELKLSPLAPWFAAESSSSDWEPHSRDDSPPYRFCITEHILKKYEMDCSQGYYGTIYEKIRNK